MPGQNYFAVCDRDREGHCLPRGTKEEREGEGTGMASDEATKQRLQGAEEESPEELEVKSPEFQAPEVVPTGPCVGVWIDRHRIGSIFTGTDGMLHLEGNLQAVFAQPPEVILEFLMEYSGVTLHFKPEAPPEMEQPINGVQDGQDEVGGDDPTETTDGQSQEDSPTPAGEEQVDDQGEEGGDEERGPPKKKGKAMPGYRRKSHGFHPDIVNLASAIEEGIPDQSNRRAAFAELHDALLDHGHDEHARVLRNHGPQPVSHAILTGAKLGTVYSQGDRVRIGDNAGTVALTPEQTGQWGFYHVNFDHRPADEVASIHHTSLRPHTDEGQKAYAPMPGMPPPPSKPHPSTVDHSQVIKQHAFHARQKQAGKEHKQKLAKQQMQQQMQAQEQERMRQEQSAQIAKEIAASTGGKEEKGIHHSAIHLGHRVRAEGPAGGTYEGVVQHQGEYGHFHITHSDVGPPVIIHSSWLTSVQHPQTGEWHNVDVEQNAKLLPNFRTRRKLLPEMEKALSTFGNVEGLMKPAKWMGPQPRKKECKGKVEDDDADWQEQTRQAGVRVRTASGATGTTAGDDIPDSWRRVRVGNEGYNTIHRADSLLPDIEGADEKGLSEIMTVGTRRPKTKGLHDDFHATGRALEAGDYDPATHAAHLDAMVDVHGEDHPLVDYARQSPQHALNAYVAHTRPREFRDGDEVVVRSGTAKNPEFREGLALDYGSTGTPHLPNHPRVRVRPHGSSNAHWPLAKLVTHHAAHYLAQQQQGS